MLCGSTACFGSLFAYVPVKHGFALEKNSVQISKVKSGGRERERDYALLNPYIKKRKGKKEFSLV